MKKLILVLVACATMSSFAVESGKQYIIRNVLSDKCIDVEGAATWWGANIQQYTCNGSSAQIFDVDLFSTTDVFEIKNENSGRIIGAMSAQSGTNVKQIYTWSENYGARLWSFVSHGNDVYTIENEGTGNPSQRTCLDVSAASTSSGANMQIWYCNGTDAQKFIITEIDKRQCGSSPCSLGRLINKNSGKLLDVTAASTDAGANIQQYEGNGSDAQKVYSGPADEMNSAAPAGFYLIGTSNGLHVLDVAYGGASDNVQQWPLVGEFGSGESWEDNQMWQFIPTIDGDNSYFIKARSDLTECLEVEMGYAWDGANIRTSACNGSDAQKWLWDGGR